MQFYGWKSAALGGLLVTLVASYYILHCPSNCKCNCDKEKCSVDCSGMSIEKIHSEFKKLPSIPINLSLRNCQLQRIPHEIQGLDIKALDVSHNQIRVIDKSDINKFKALERLDVSHNFLDDVISLQSPSLWKSLTTI